MAKTAYAPKAADTHAANVAVLKDRIKTGKLTGAYVFYGEEDYTKNHYYKELLKACGDKKLGVRTLCGDDFTLSEFVNACDTAPGGMLGLWQDPSDEEGAVEAQYRMVRLVSPALDVLTKSDEKHFLSRIEDPDDGTIILFWLYAGEEDKLTKGLYKKIAESALVVNFRHEAVGSNGLVSWILRHFSKAGIEIDRQTVLYLNNYVGNDMTTLKNEIDNCIAYLRYEGRKTLTVEDVDFLCKKSVTAQIFDISSSAIAGNYEKAMAAFGVFRSAGEKPLLVFGTLSKAVYDLCIVDRMTRAGDAVPMIAKNTGLREFVVKNYKSLIQKRGTAFAAYAAEVILQYDTLLKSSRTDGYALLSELIFKLACWQ